MEAGQVLSTVQQLGNVEHYTNLRIFTCQRLGFSPFYEQHYHVIQFSFLFCCHDPSKTSLHYERLLFCFLLK